MKKRLLISLLSVIVIGIIATIIIYNLNSDELKQDNDKNNQQETTNETTNITQVTSNENNSDTTIRNIETSQNNITKKTQNTTNAPTTTNATTATNAINSSQAGQSVVNQVVNLVNQERAKVGLSALNNNNNVLNAAYVRAQEIEGKFSHTRPNGSGFSTVLTENSVSFSGAGENIAYGQQSSEQVMQSWMSSAGHKANILNSSFSSIGVGHYKSASGVNYWVQLFIY